ncbi:MAG: 8-amino-7-oxononanoate synthase [Syntrophobacterales bacterium]|jgi:8-amino-7-oxononanoate synthase|nr:8-amino-7-oxononanoate synthase [Syntrophobacterales bacterium]
MRDRLKVNLENIKQKGNYRAIRHVKPLDASWILFNGKKFLNLCSNSYLSLHAHPQVIEAAAEAAHKYGAGTCSSRSISGSIELYRVLEDEIASYKCYPSGLVFSTGYMANMGVIATLTEKDDVIFSDELNHSSLIDSTRLSRAKKVIYRHRDMNDLEGKIRKDRSKGIKFVVSESVFSMDGDIAPVADLVELRNRYGYQLILDDAHGTGVFGDTGRGGAEFFRLTGSMDVEMATFGKSFGSFGAFVLGDKIVTDYLVNRARTFMYTTALSPSVLAASIASIRLIKDNPSFRDDLWGNIEYIRRHMRDAGFDLKDSIGPIVPVVVGEDAKAVEMQHILMEKGVFIQAVRPPTVPPGTSRLRLTVVRSLTMDEMDFAINVLKYAGKKAGLI